MSNAAHSEENNTGTIDVEDDDIMSRQDRYLEQLSQMVDKILTETPKRPYCLFFGGSVIASADTYEEITIIQRGRYGNIARALLYPRTVVAPVDDDSDEETKTD